jgi:hypothetical protein
VKDPHVPSANAIRSMFETLYERFNARDVDSVLASLTDDVDWPNGWGPQRCSASSATPRPATAR